MDIIENNKRIAKNTGMLYIRMLLIMAVTLYTSRVVLNTIGVEDFGIFNVVGGFVAMLGFLNNSMTVATQRFLSFELGKDDSSQIAKVFSMSMNIHALIAIVILLIAETIGLWFVNNQLTISPDRMIAARWVYQFAVLSFLINVITVPFNSIIIAHERMSAFAVVSILEVVLKLFIVYILQWFDYDSLKFYAFLMFIVVLLIRIIYVSYSIKYFEESRLKIFWDKILFKRILSFTSWSLWGSAASVMYSQGVNVLLNIFFGPVVNAARGIAYQVRSAVNSFVYNFQMAMNPQIIKSYASGNLNYMHKLIYQGSKYSFFLLFTISLPIIIEADIILKIWLKVVPEYSLVFTRLVIINILIDSLSGPLMTGAQASGRIKVYQGVVGGLLLLVIPVSYLFLKMGYPPETTLYISIIISLAALVVRLKILEKLIDIRIKKFFIEVVSKIVLVSVTTIIIPVAVYAIFNQNFYRFFLIAFSSVICSLFSIYILGLDKNEKEYSLNFIRRRLRRFRIIQ